MKILLLIVVTFFASSVYAVTEAHIGFFIKNEMSGDDYINGVGTEVWLLNEETHIGVALNSSIGTAHVADTYNFKHSYVAWDMGIKFGYFSDIFVYGELGFDLGELILHDRDEDDYDEYEDSYDFVDFIDDVFIDDSYDNYDDTNDIDTYIGAGVGIKFDNVIIEAFSRYRQIDGEYWKANNQNFSGLKLTVTF